MASSGRGSGVVGYNVQVAVDIEHHLIVTHEVTNSGSDWSQLGLRSSARTRACSKSPAFDEGGQFTCGPPPHGLWRQTVSLRFAHVYTWKYKTPLTRAGATARRHHRNPAEAHRRWRGRGASRSGSVSVTTHALFAGKIQRKVRTPDGFRSSSPPSRHVRLELGNVEFSGGKF